MMIIMYNFIHNFKKKMILLTRVKFVIYDHAFSLLMVHKWKYVFHHEIIQYYKIKIDILVIKWMHFK